MFITFEGTEGSGKSMQARKLVERLRAAGRTVVATHEPGGTPLGSELRQLVLAQNGLEPVARAEALVMNASRAQLVETVIRPALRRGEIVVCDRFADSTLAYQGAGRGLDALQLASVISFATAGLEPDVTMLLDVPVQVGLARKHSQAERNRFEDEALAFHGRVRQAYLDLADARPARWHRFDARAHPDAIAEQIYQTVATKLGLQP